MRKVVKLFGKSQKLLLALIIVILVIVVTFVNPVFLRIDNITSILKTYTILGMMSCGMMFVIISGGIDVSVAALITVSAYMTGLFAINFSSNIFLCIVVGCMVGMILGLINGLLITRLRVPPLVATLTFNTILQSVISWATGGKLLNGIPTDLIEFGSIKIFNFPIAGTEGSTGIPIQFFFLIFIALLTYFIARYTRVGRGIYAMGGDAGSAERIGYNLFRVQMFIYGYMGFICGMAGVVNTTIMSKVDINSYIGYEMDVITVVVLGGTSVTGGYGTVGGSLLGVLFYAVVKNGLMLMKVSSYYQTVAIAVAMIITICINSWREVSAERRRVHVDVM